MFELQIVPIDICFFVLILVLGIMALMKGFVKELFSKISVFGGLAAGIFFAPKLEPYVRDSFAVVAKISMVVSFFLIFIVVFLVICIIQHFVEKAFEGEIMKGLDRSLGFFIGVLEGFILVTFIIALLKYQTFYKCDTLLENSLFNKLLGNLFTIPSNIPGFSS